MNPTASQKRWTGLFLAGGVLVLISTLMWLGGSRLGRERIPVVCEIRSESVEGLSVGGKVSLRGLDVGRIVAIGLDSADPEILRISLELDPDAPVHRDAKASLEIFGITGLKYLELTPGTPGAGRVRAGDVLQARPSLASSLVSVADSLARTALSVLRNLDALTGTARQGQLDSILLDLRATTREAAAMTGELRDARLDHRLSGMADRIDGTLAVLDSAVRRTRPDRTLAGVDSATRALAGAARRADLMLARSQGDVYRSLEDLRSSMRDLSQFSATLRDNPSALLRSPSRSE